MKAHIARNQNAGVPLVLCWNLSGGDRGILDGMAPAFGMKVLPVGPADLGRTVGDLLGEPDPPPAKAVRPSDCPAAILLANFKDKDVDTLLDLLRKAQVRIPIKALATKTNRGWAFGDLLDHLQEEARAMQQAIAAQKAAGVQG